MLPLVARANEEILRNRAFLMDVETRVRSGATLSASESDWIAALAEGCGVRGIDFAQLKKRVDVVPISLALAQATEESRWGTSRLARDGNALYSQRAQFQVPNLRPLGRSQSDGVFVQKSDELQQLVRSYVHNLNTHRSCRQFRNQRAMLRQRNMALDGLDLAAMLERYFERGPDYVRTIRTIITANGFQSLDSAPPPLRSGSLPPT